jgi:hypothetical protein
MSTKRFAVSIFNFSNNELRTEIVSAESWREAAIKHTKSFWNASEENDPDEFENPEDAENEILEIVPDTLEEAKRDAFDMEGAFDCMEIKP